MTACLTRRIVRIGKSSSECRCVVDGQTLIRSSIHPLVPATRELRALPRIRPFVDYNANRGLLSSSCSLASPGKLSMFHVSCLAGVDFAHHALGRVEQVKNLGSRAMERWK